jgi:threonine synthase
MASFVTHLEAAIDGTRLPADRIQTVHEGRPLWVRYDLDAVRRCVTPDDLAKRPPTMWKYPELLPVPDGVEPVSLGETVTPLLRAPRLGAELGLSNLWIKDESHLPTGSFKSRGLAMAVTLAKYFGLKRLAIPTAGNAGGALAAYAARAGLEAFVFMPQDTPAANRVECILAGARTFLVNGLINDCATVVRNGMNVMNWFDCSTLKEPYRLEGKKTMGLELAEQFDWSLPDVIVYPTGGGTGLIGMWKAFNELRTLGWLRSDTMPKMVSVQSDGCAPIVRAFDKGQRFAEPWDNAQTCASGLRVPAAVGDFMILDAIRERRGWAVAVPESQIADAMRRATAAEGISFCPESAACVLALELAVAEGRIAKDDRVVLFNTASAMKYAELNAPELPRITDPKSADYAGMAPYS